MLVGIPTSITNENSGQDFRHIYEFLHSTTEYWTHSGWRSRVSIETSRTVLKAPLSRGEGRHNDQAELCPNRAADTTTIQLNALNSTSLLYTSISYATHPGTGLEDNNPVMYCTGASLSNTKLLKVIHNSTLMPADVPAMIQALCSRQSICTLDLVREASFGAPKGSYYRTRAVKQRCH